jgi:hypothetical protein
MATVTAKPNYYKAIVPPTPACGLPHRVNDTLTVRCTAPRGHVPVESHEYKYAWTARNE